MTKEWDVLVLDLDGTLLCGQGEVSHSNLHALDMVRDLEMPNHTNFLYDGSNFRGYNADIELIAKAYANDFGVAITNKASFKEDTTLTDRNAEVIRTDHLEQNQAAMLAEGLAWLRRKYGFNSRWAMVHYVKTFYNLFFENNPDYLKFKL